MATQLYAHPTGWRFLAEASGMLDRSLDYQETLTNIVRSVLPRVADYVAISSVCANGSASRELSQHRNPRQAKLLDRLAAYWPSLLARNPRLGGILRGEETCLVELVDDDALRSAIDDDVLLRILKELAFVSVIFVPLEVRQRRFGCLMLATTTDSNRRYTRHDVGVANEIARRSARAIDHALLYRKSEQAVRAREELMAVVSHDLKNPLSTIQLATHLLLEEILPQGQPQAGRAQLQMILRASERMYRLVHDLLDIAAADAGQLPIHREAIAAHELVVDAFELLRPLALAKHIALIMDPELDLPLVHADRDRILQVFSNLGGNAVTHTADGGRVEISAARRGEFVEFSVKDTGIGIARDHLPHVFDRFWQAKRRAHNGIGLGLAIARSIVQAHDGEICAASRIGEGTEFTFTLPITSA